VVVIFNLK